MRYVLLSAVLIGSAAVAAPSVKDGIEAWQRADYAAAVGIWRPLAEKGDADAAFNLGQAYRLGRGVDTDLADAQLWLEKAARAGHLDAQVTLGLLLFQNGVQSAGLRWLKSAAERGEPRAMLIYGTALYNCDGVACDPVRAYAYVSRAAAQGLAAAKATLEEMDNALPLAQRKQGVALAIEKVEAAKSPKAAAKKKAPAAPAAAPVQQKGGWRIQLGAFSQRASAETLFKRLSGTAPVAGRQPYLVTAGAVTRLQVGPFATRDAAAAACRALSAKGQACFPVSAK